jgi:hypothetical protein
MRMIGCDLHTAKQTIAMLDRDTGEVVEQTLSHEAETVREFYAAIPKPAVVGIADERCLTHARPPSRPEVISWQIHCKFRRSTTGRLGKWL